MRKLVLGITIGFLAASTLAWAFTVKFPNTLKIRGMAFVDEAGNVLGGITPTTVDVVNMPTSLDVNVTSLPATAGSGGGKAVLTVYGTTTCPSGFTSAYSGNTFGWGFAVLTNNTAGLTVSGACYANTPGSIGIPGASASNTTRTAIADCAVCIES